MLIWQSNYVKDGSEILFKIGKEKSQMKKLVQVIALFVCFIILTACGNNSSSNSAPSSLGGMRRLRRGRLALRINTHS